jgi:hypothetical protein
MSSNYGKQSPVDFAERVRGNQRKLRDGLTSQYDFIVCGLPTVRTPSFGFAEYGLNHWKANCSPGRLSQKCSLSSLKGLLLQEKEILRQKSRDMCHCRQVV